MPGSTAETAFERVAVRLMNVPGVSAGTMFGASALKFRGKVFAMLVKGRLVVKLPSERVTRLVCAGSGQLFDPGNGRLMKEWVAIPDSVTVLPDSVTVRWSGLVDEAEVFVSLGDKSARPRVRAVRRPALATKRRDARRRDQRAGNDRALTTETGDPR